VAFLVVGQGTQFITGPCTSDADCASGCCGFNTGKCAGPVFAQEVDGGCGFGNAQPNDNAALSLLGSATTAAVAQTTSESTITAAVAQTTSESTITATVAQTTSESTITAAAVQASTATTSASKSAGTQFITGPCTSDADCADGCCGFNTGKCAGPVVAQEIDGGCGFGNAQPNDNAARALGASKRGIPYRA
jgi:hypothetical protein